MREPASIDSETVTASFDDVAQVAQFAKTHAEGGVWRAACRLLSVLASASSGTCTATFEPVTPGRRDTTHTCDLDTDHGGPHHCPRCDTSWRGHA